MTIFLRTDKNETVVDIELNNNIVKGMDLHSYVSIEAYSKILFTYMDDYQQVVEDFTQIQELRSWFHEVYLDMLQPDKPSLTHAINEIKAILNPIALRYDLNIVTD